MNLDLVFQNDHFVAVNKPGNCLSVPSRFRKKDSRPVLGHILREQIGEEVYPIHRLDYEVSGLILFALSREAHQEANRLFEQRKVRKSYIALSEGIAPEWKEATWKCKLLRGKKRAYEHEKGKNSVTQVQFLGTQNENQLKWSLRPETGRSHQLRYELFRHQYPILGDELYGSNEGWPNGIALQSIELNFSESLKKFELPDQLALSKELHLFAD